MNTRVHSAGNAVNGIFTDYSQTETSNDPKWWTVDLQSKYSIGKVELYNRKEFGKKQLLLNPLTLLTLQLVLVNSVIEFTTFSLEHCFSLL